MIVSTIPSDGAGHRGWFVASVHADGTVVLEGELDAAGLDALRAALDQAMLDDGETIVVDAHNLTFIDSTAVSELLRYELVASGQKRRLCIERPRGQVARVLRFLELEHILIAPDAGSV